MLGLLILAGFLGVTVTSNISLETKYNYLGAEFKGHIVFGLHFSMVPITAVGFVECVNMNESQRRQQPNT